MLWSLGDTWYVQPTTAEPFTPISKDGSFEATIHGGYAFAAMVVRTHYSPDARLAALPAVGGDILAIRKAYSKR